MMRKIISNWSNFPKIQADLIPVKDAEELSKIVSQSEEVIARGNGRSYGDASLNNQIISTLQLKHPFNLDKNNDVLEVGAGFLISEILDKILPEGYFLPVVPGTKFVSIGGAVAADIHGKNHYRDGSIGPYILSLELHNGKEIVTCNLQQNATLFLETIGGMGLTGIIINVFIKLIKINSCFMSISSNKVNDFDLLLGLFENQKSMGFQAAWIDISSLKNKKVNALYTFGDYATLEELPVNYLESSFNQAAKSIWSIPIMMPGFTLNKLLSVAFNYAYFHLHFSKSKVVHLYQFLFPLDGLSHWNRLYGSKGFLQYQFVIPIQGSTEALESIISEINGSEERVYLAVLKRLGSSRENAVMSFPLDGYTLALDFKITKGIFSLLDRLDLLVIKYGGRIYLAKDSRMSQQVFSKSYQKIVSNNPKFASLLSKRLGLS